MKAKFKPGQLVKGFKGPVREVMEIIETEIGILYNIKIESGQVATFIDLQDFILDKYNETRDSKMENKKDKVNELDIKITLRDMLETFKIKNQKYGNSFEKSLDKYGIISALTRMSDKWNRLENLILNNDNGTEDERLEDTLIDLANYCVMTAVYISNKEKEND